MTHFVCLSIFLFVARSVWRHSVSVCVLQAYLELEFGLNQLHNIGPGARLVDVDRLIRLAAADEAGALQVLRAGASRGGTSGTCHIRCCHSGHRLRLIIR